MAERSFADPYPSTDRADFDEMKERADERDFLYQKMFGGMMLLGAGLIIASVTLIVLYFVG